MLFDLTTDTLIQSYHFSEDEAPLTNSFLNDIVVDVPHQFAYITGYLLEFKFINRYWTWVYSTSRRIARVRRSDGMKKATLFF